MFQSKTFNKVRIRIWKWERKEQFHILKKNWYHQTSSNRRMSTMFLFIDSFPYGILCMIQNPQSLENP